MLTLPVTSITFEADGSTVRTSLTSKVPWILTGNFSSLIADSVVL